MSSVDLELILAAFPPGGASCLTSATELESAGGPHTFVASARFAVDYDNKSAHVSVRLREGGPGG